MSSATLTEPRVLAHTKRRLFPDDTGYAVTDTQFAREQWLSDGQITADVRETLAPFNRVRLGSGYPDLVGVRPFDRDLLAVERLGDQPPVIAVEAKGVTDSGRVDVQRGIVQAYDRLDEANVAVCTAPTSAVTQHARTMASELNVGVFGVDDDGSVRPLVKPRAVGTRTTSDARAIRFQAGAQGVADQSFLLNHPKNYLAYPLAVAHDKPTESVLADRVVKATAGAHDGAVFLGLVTEAVGTVELTELGREVVRFAVRRHGSVDAALDQFTDWKGSPTRFVKLAPRWGELARRVVFQYPATDLLVRELQTMANDGHRRPSLVDVVEWLYSVHPTFTVELFLRGTDDVRTRALTENGELRSAVLRDGDSYHSPTVFQLKTIWYHAGILTETGTEPSNLDPTADEWALREPVVPKPGPDS